VLLSEVVAAMIPALSDRDSRTVDQAITILQQLRMFSYRLIHILYVKDSSIKVAEMRAEKIDQNPLLVLCETAQPMIDLGDILKLNRKLDVAMEKKARL